MACGKKRRLRKRANSWGGRKTAPPAFLEAAKRTQFKPGRPGHRVCSATQRNGSPCTRLALKGMIVCEAHGGCGILAIQGELQPSGRAKARIAAQIAAGKEQGPPPLDLIKLPLYRQANQWTRSGSPEPSILPQAKRRPDGHRPAMSAGRGLHVCISTRSPPWLASAAPWSRTRSGPPGQGGCCW